MLLCAGRGLQGCTLDTEASAFRAAVKCPAERARLPLQGLRHQRGTSCYSAVSLGASDVVYVLELLVFKYNIALNYKFRNDSCLINMQSSQIHNI